MNRIKKFCIALIFTAVLLTVLSSCGDASDGGAEYTLRINCGVLFGFESVGEGLVDIEVPSGVTEISEGAFKGKRNLRSVTLPEGLTHIGKEAFYGCIALERINIPDSVISIDRSSFVGCYGVCAEEDEVYYVGNWAVDCKKDAIGITLKQGTVGIASCAFKNRENLQYAVMPEGLRIIGDEAFMECGIREAVIPNSTELIGIGAFEKSRIGRCQLPEGITRIPDRCFYLCDGLDADIPDSVVSVGVNGLLVRNYVGESGYFYYDGWFVGKYLEYDLGDGITVKLEKGTVGIADGALVFSTAEATNVELRLPDGIKYLGNNCIDLNGGSVNIPPSVENFSAEKMVAYGTRIIFDSGREELDISDLIGLKTTVVLPMYTKILPFDNRGNERQATLVFPEKQNRSWIACIGGEERALTYEEKSDSEFIMRLICDTEGFEWLRAGDS